MKKQEVAEIVKTRLVKGCENTGSRIYVALVLAVSRWQRGASIVEELEELKVRFPSKREIDLIERCAKEIARLLEQ